MISPEKKRRFSDLLKYIRGLDSVKQFATRLEIKLPTYSAWENARAFPSEELWSVVSPKLCEFTGFTPHLIDQYLRGEYELTDLVDPSNTTEGVPRARPVMTAAKFEAWLQTLSLQESIQVLQAAVERVADLTTQSPKSLEDSLPQSLTSAVVEPEPVMSSSTLEVLEDLNLTNEAEILKTILQLVEPLNLKSILQVDSCLRDL